MNVSSNPKRKTILLTGKELFWKFGIKRVTIEEICMEAGVSKMTFYKFFSNKMDLVRTIMDDIFDISLKEYRSIMDSDLPFTEKVSQSILLKREQTKAMSSEFFSDFYGHADPEMVEYFEQLKNKNIQMIADDYARAQKDGDIRQDIKVEFIIYFLNQLLEMTHDDKLLNLYDHPQDMIMEITKFFFYGILNREVHT
ncbi:MAG: TetR/AcrR family transcriptional regulator [Bacteroidales bacterium]|nr:TetR/AcrR family transcriptional regulator [Bacteroidales bacterium]